MFSRTKVQIVLAVAALFVLAFAYQTSAYSGGGSTPFTYTGNIVSLDNEHNSVAVQAGPNDVMSFKLGDGASVTKCDMDKHFGDLRIGDNVTVSYFEEPTGGYIASEVDWLPMGLNRC
jgi:hypothetical protein